MAHYPIVQRQGSVTLYENPTAMPRAFVTYAATGWQRVSELLARTPERWKNHALIETPDGRAPLAWHDADRPITPVRILAQRAHPVTLETTLPRAAWLVVSEAYYPGWEALVDGQRATLFPADVDFRGVRLTAGTHRVLFEYWPRSFRVGLALSLVSLPIALLLLPFKSLAGIVERIRPHAL